MAYLLDGAVQLQLRSCDRAHERVFARVNNIILINDISRLNKAALHEASRRNAPPRAKAWTARGLESTTAAHKQFCLRPDADEYAADATCPCLHTAPNARPVAAFAAHQDSPMDSLPSQRRAPATTIANPSLPSPRTHVPCRSLYCTAVSVDGNTGLVHRMRSVKPNLRIGQECGLSIPPSNTTLSLRVSRLHGLHGLLLFGKIRTAREL